MFGTGQLPKFEEDLFKVEPGGYYLIPTAEVPVTNIHADEILDPSAADRLLRLHALLPQRGRLVRQGRARADPPAPVQQGRAGALLRPGRVVGPARAADLARRGGAASGWRLHYRVVTLCTGDLGFSAAKTYDLEVWMPSQGVYREISSCSNFTDFQARRAKIRYQARRPKAKTAWCTR